MNEIVTQIYEVQTPKDAQRLAEAGVDHMGSVVLSEDDWRHPELLDAIKIARSLQVKCSLIPLFSDRNTIERVLDFYQPDIVHFCESLSDGQRIADHCHTLVANQETIKHHYPQIAIMRSIPIALPGFTDWVPTLELATLFEATSDYFLTDTLLIDTHGPSDHQQPVDGFVGITGRTCDWQMAAELVNKSRIPVILAGGLSPENVFDGIVQVRPAGVDSCTGTNAQDTQGHAIRFKKDWPKVRRFVDETRRAQHCLASTAPQA